MFILSFQKDFLEFSTSSIYLVFLHKFELFHSYIHPIEIVIVRVLVGDQEKRSPSVSPLVIRGVVEVATSVSLRVRVCCSCENK